MKTLPAGLGVLTAGLLAASGLHAQQAPAATPTSSNPDVRCLIVGSIMEQSPDPQTKASGPVVLVYYLGRIDSAQPRLDLEKAIRDEQASLTNGFPAVAKACVDALNGRSTALAQITAHLHAADPAAPPPKP